jgi:hypothetical protein
VTITVRLLNVAEIAANYGVRTAYVYRLAYLHRWRRIKHGRVIYYDLADVDAVLGQD